MDDSTDGLQDQRSTVSGIVSNEGSTVKHNFSGHHLSTMISSQLKWKCLVGTAGQIHFFFLYCSYYRIFTCPAVCCIYFSTLCSSRC